MDSRAAVLQSEYEQRFARSAAYRDAVWSVLCARFFSRFVARSATLLDLGAGWGEFSRHIVAARKYAMDLNPDCESRLAGCSQVLLQDCAAPWQLEDGALDVVFTSNFLEHLPDKLSVEKTLAEAHRCLKPGGKIICMGPNIKYLAGPYWDFWDHFVPLTEESLAEVLSIKGFKVTEKIGRFLPYTMSNGRQPPLFALRFYLALPFAWRWFGKQFLVVAERP